MDNATLRTQLVTDFSLEGMQHEEQEEMLLEIAKTIQKQFLLDVYDTIGDQQFDALQASASMGEEFYATTLKHLVPNYDELFQKARNKIVDSFKKAN